MASPRHKDLAPIRPAQLRDFVLQLLVFGFAFSAYRIVYVNVPGWWWMIFLAITVVTFIMMVAGWTSYPASRKPRARKGAFAEYIKAGAKHINLMVDGFAGGEVFTAAKHYDQIEAGSYAKVFWDAGESILLFFYDLAETLDPLKKADRLTTYVNVYDELTHFKQVHKMLEESGHPYVTLHLQSMGADWGRRFIAWLEHTDPRPRHYQIEAIHIMEGTMRLRRIQRFAVAALSFYWGNPLLQWLWIHGLYALVFPTPKVERKLCKAAGRESVTDLISYRHQYQSVCGTLSRLNALHRSHCWRVLEDPPPNYSVFYSALATDSTTNPKKGLWILRAVYGKVIGHYLVPGIRRTIGDHGFIAERGPQWQAVARMFIAHRNANPI